MEIYSIIKIHYMQSMKSKKLVQEKKIAVMKDVVNSSTDLPEGSVDWAGICTRKRKPSERLKGVAG
jgi:hypothetical protein